MVDGLGKLIVERRKELGYSQQDLARMIGVPAANLSQLEHSPSRWRSRLIPALADALGVSQLELVMAASVISDLPSFPSHREDDDTTDVFFPTLTTNGHADPAKLRDQLRQLSDELSAAEVDFLVAVAETFRQRDLSERHATAAIPANDQEPIEAGAW